MSEHDRILIGHFHTYGAEAHRPAIEGGEDLYRAEAVRRYAIAYLVQIVGEASYKLSREYKQRHPSVPWEQIAGVRHRLVHAYFAIDYGLIWDIALHHLPMLLEQVRVDVEDAPDSP